MRLKWRLWVRSGTLKTVLLATMFFFAIVMLTHNQNRYQDPSEVVLRVSEPKVEEKYTKSQQFFEVDLNPIEPVASDDPIDEPLSDWLMVQHANRELFVYAAYLDDRKGIRYVRVIAIIRKKKKVTQCEVFLGNSTRRVTAKSKFIRENWNLLYAASFVLCELPSDIGIPDAVALVHNNEIDRSSTVPVQVMTDRAHHGNMSVCIKPFHYEYNRAVWLVEFMELYRLLGANHFIYYNHTVGPDVQKVLEYYEKEGIATIMPWALPVKSQKEIRTEGIFAALNDCNYRSVGRFDFAAMVDVDEFLIPRKHSRLIELIADLGVYDTYVFQNVFFYLYWENDTAVHNALYGGNYAESLGVSLFGDESKTPYLLSAYKTRRLTKAHKPGQRSKYIVRPEKVVEVGNHNVWEHVGGKRVVNVPKDKGLSHHYRICEFGGFDCLKDSNEVDRAAHKWLVPLMRRVSEKCKQIFPFLQRCPVAPPLGSPW